jgi:predicted RNase H-like HicB family nuclease
MAMAKEALDGCLEADISRGLPVPPPACQEGYPIPVASHIVLALRFA